MKTLLIAFLTGIFCLSAAAATQAVPVTLGFEAVVENVNLLPPSNLPFAIEIGDVITGQFSFVPIDTQPNALGLESITDTVQEFDLSLSFESENVVTSTYQLRVTDNSQAIDGQLVNDIVSLGCTSTGPNACNPGTLANFEDLIWFFSLPLLADGGVLNGADISGDPAVWNQFAGRLSITIQEQGIADVLRVSALTERFFLIPEPTTALSVTIALIMIFGTRSICCHQINGLVKP